jgi:hypothetical protein
MTSPPSQSAEPWTGRGSTSIIPPPDYWAHLIGVASAAQIEQLQDLSDRRLTEFTPSDLAPPKDTALELLARVAADGWLSQEQRQRCPNCDFELDKEQAGLPTCPSCDEGYSQHGGLTTETVYVRRLPWSRSVDWVVAIHGMNTHGAWQEEFSWHLATTWGRSVPVAIYKYGILRVGVISARRRRKLQNELRNKLAVLRDQAHAHGFSGKPDVIAHSFGTWLLGHLIENELTRKPDGQLRFGRIILTGSILAPDFDWKRLTDSELVEDVLNHSASKDRIVPLARFAIRDSGPSGRRGFEGDQIINVRTEGCGHSDLFSIDKCIEGGKCCQRCTGAANEVRHLDYFYKRYWRPFLTLPSQELRQLMG